jgi:hypothetical protein
MERVRTQYATWTLFPLLGVRPHLGRFFGPEEERAPGGEPVAVLAHAAWRAHFGGDPAIVGRAIALGGRRFTVVGVAPEGFTGAGLEPADVWLPVGAGQSPSGNWATTRNMTWLRLVARLKPGVSAASASVDATTAHRRAYDGRHAWQREGRVAVHPLHHGDDGGESLEVSVSRWLVGVAAIVLLVACANVANLLLSRVVARQREVAVRLALGVSRLRLVRLLLAEGLVLAVAGGAGALLVAYWGGRLIRATLLPDVDWPGSPVDGRVLLFTAAVTAVTGLLVSLLPAVGASRPRLAPALRAGTRQAGGRRSPLRTARGRGPPCRSARRSAPASSHDARRCSTASTRSCAPGPRWRRSRGRPARRSTPR